MLISSRLHSLVKKLIYLNSQESSLLDAFDIDELIKMDILLSCQGGDYTKKILTSPAGERLVSGHWIDAASTSENEF